MGHNINPTLLQFLFGLDDAEEDLDLELPNQWLWDIIDEFIYQFQSFCHYRSKVKKLSETEIAVLKTREDVKKKKGGGGYGDPMTNSKLIFPSLLQHPCFYFLVMEHPRRS